MPAPSASVERGPCHLALLEGKLGAIVEGEGSRLLMADLLGVLQGLHVLKSLEECLGSAEGPGHELAWVVEVEPRPSITPRNEKKTHSGKPLGSLRWVNFKRVSLPIGLQVETGQDRLPADAGSRLLTGDVGTAGNAQHVGSLLLRPAHSFAPSPQVLMCPFREADGPVLHRPVPVWPRGVQGSSGAVYSEIIGTSAIASFRLAYSLSGVR